MADNPFQRIVEKLDRLPQIVGNALWLEAELIMTDAKKRTPVRTGTLRASGFVERPKITGKRIRVEMGFGGPAAKYARYVHDGTRPHIIRPRTKKALYWEGAPHPVRFVRHPGTKANPWFRNTMDEHWPYLPRRLGQRITEALKGE